MIPVSNFSVDHKSVRGETRCLGIYNGTYSIADKFRRPVKSHSYALSIVTRRKVVDTMSFPDQKFKARDPFRDPLQFRYDSTYMFNTCARILYRNVIHTYYVLHTYICFSLSLSLSLFVSYARAFNTSHDHCVFGDNNIAA
jgi:hypothetical protein